MKKKVLFPALLAALALPLCLQQKPVKLNAEFIGEFSSSNDYAAYAREVNAQMADEGFVLLKNDGFLPMSGDESLSVVGKASINLARGGGGSGNGSPSSEIGSIDLKKSLTDAGFTLNPTTDSFYSSRDKSGSGRTNGNGNWQGNSDVTIGETAIEKVTNEPGLLDSFSEYNDAAIMVIAREGTEGSDIKMCNATDTTKTNSGDKVLSHKHALELSDNEQALFDLLHEHFDHIIMIINSSNVFECGQFEDDEKVSGVLWVGNVGDVGPGAIGRILSGEVNPSGRTVDTWARDFTKDPTFQNFSDNAQTNLTVNKNGDEAYCAQDTMFNADGTPTMSFGTDKNYNNHNSPRWADETAKVVSGGLNGVKPSAYVSYEEGIYVDYRYYETKYADMAAEDKDAADEWYEGEEGVVYPFGYGCSYTTFDQKIVRVKPAKSAVLTANDEIVEVSVKVTNTGNVAGKDVVQLYWKAPYTAGGIEKADHVLCAFDKTEILKPGDSQVLQLKFYLQDVANYDYNDANKNGFKGYELDAGDYQVILGKNAHEAYGFIPYSINAGIKFENDRFTGNKVENRFTDRGFLSSMPEGDLEFTQMSRADFEGTFPTHPTIEDRTLAEGSRYEEFLTHEFSLADFEKGVEGEFEYIPEVAHKTEQDFIDNGWEQKSTSPRTQLSAMKDVPYEDEKWDEFMNEFTYSEMVSIVRGSSRNTSAVNSVGKGTYNEGDGPQQFNKVYWVSSPIIAATFNVRLAHLQGECCGMEAHIYGKNGWWGPAVNTHRSPFGGRNFEYYAADPFLMGRIAANVVGAATDRGIYCYFKHFAVNDQEKNRESGISFVNEQALREIYLKSFQMVFEEGKSIGVMGSYNRIGLTEAAGHYGLMTEVLRDEWGFKGCVLSDMAHPGNGSVNYDCYESINLRMLAGNNTQLTTSGTFESDIDTQWNSSAWGGKGAVVLKSDTSTIAWSMWYAMRELTKGYMYMAVHSSGMFKGLTIAGDAVELTYKIDEGISYDVEVEGATEFKLNDRIELPEGLEFDNGSLSGKISHVGLYRIDVIATVGSSKKAVKLLINIVPDEAEYDENIMEAPGSNNGGGNNGGGGAKKGCFGDVTSMASLIALLSLAGVGIALLAIDKKRRA